MQVKMEEKRKIFTERPGVGSGQPVSNSGEERGFRELLSDQPDRSDRSDTAEDKA